ncbi:MAG: cytochrome c [Candidatus Hydrogenedentes bacterium]|nr:cytochrome c [Candidatus Hydrogenedentota bacterium]
MRKSIRVLGMVVLAAVMSVAGGYAVSGVHAQDAAVPQPALEPAMKTGQMMEAFFEGVHESLSAEMKAEPQTPKGWKTIKSSASAFAELSNLVMIHKEYDDMKTWYEMATVMKTTALDLAKAADEKNFAQATEKYKALVESCNACHKKFEPETGPVIEL